MPGVCYQGSCVSYSSLPDGQPTDPTPLANGATCADATCQDWECQDTYGACTNGYCDNESVSPTYKCTAWAGTGEPCPNYNECNTDTHYCTWDSTDSREECFAFVPVGGDCSNGWCNSGTAYCDDTLHCKARLQNGAACTTGSDCLSDYCYGTCSGGDFDGMPCSSSYYCTNSGVCNGICGEYDSGWNGCQ